MTNFWFWTVAVMLAIYVVLDGYDLGSGVLHLWIAKTEKERGELIDSIHPLWDGNEVWLIVAGTVLYFAFPQLYASGFSGFYLPLMMVLWLLILRGTAVEFRGLIYNQVWMPFWDVVFSCSSTALAVFFGVALGNVVRGVPLDASHAFFLPLWTTFGVRSPVGILDWYTISTGVLALVTLSVHGALWIALRTLGSPSSRALKFVSRVSLILIVATVGVSLMSFYVQPHLEESYERQPFGLVFPLFALIAMIGIRIWSSRLKALQAFLCSSVFIVAMLCSVSFGLFPFVLPSLTDPALALTVENASAPVRGLEIGLYWFIPGIMLAISYTIYTHRKFMIASPTGK
jgi:cytochrome d ubiquinol oxidase subunit II